MGSLEGRRRAAFIGAPAVLTVGVGAVATRASTDRTKTMAVVGAAGAGIALSQWLWVAVDRAADGWLSRRTAHPRIVIALLNGVATAALNTIEERAHDPAGQAID